MDSHLLTNSWRRALGRSLVYAVPVLVVAVACSGSPELSESSDSASSSISAPESEPAEPEPTESEPVEPEPTLSAESPDPDIPETVAIQSLSEQIYGTNEQLVKIRIQVEELTAECMRDLGWEYVPFPDQSSVPRDIASDPELRAVWGYGISTVIGQPNNPLAPTTEINPNTAISANLSQGTLNVYYTDLYGPPTDGDAVFELAGCAGRANDEVFSSELPYAFDENIGNAFAGMNEVIQSDPEFLRAAELWRSCMRESGYSFEHSQEIRSQIEMETEVIVNDSDSDPEALAQLQARELLLARDDYDCREGEFSDVLDAVREAAEADIRAEFNIPE